VEAPVGKSGDLDVRILGLPIPHDGRDNEIDRTEPGGWPAQKTKGWTWRAGVHETSKQAPLSALPDLAAPLIGHVLDMHYIAAVQVMQVLKPT
jgi:hypothetical protein